MSNEQHLDASFTGFIKKTKQWKGLWIKVRQKNIITFKIPLD